MRITWRLDKERRNIFKHGFNFSLAERVFADPLSIIVHTYPDPDGETWIHILSLPEATTHE